MSILFTFLITSRKNTIFSSPAKEKNVMTLQEGNCPREECFVFPSLHIYSRHFSAFLLASYFFKFQSSWFRVFVLSSFFGHYVLTFLATLPSEKLREWFRFENLKWPSSTTLFNNLLKELKNKHEWSMRRISESRGVLIKTDMRFSPPFFLSFAAVIAYYSLVKLSRKFVSSPVYLEKSMKKQFGC